MPLVSICLPNLNNRAYLEERLKSIQAQTLGDWELIVSDNFSDDGAWEYLSAAAQKDSRILAEQAPRKGMYENWNACVRRARGTYIYVATSDDTMEPTCLEKLVHLLNLYPRAGIAQCALQVIDSKSLPLPDGEQWENYTLGMYDKPLVTRSNLRIAPHDGLLHPALFTICTSITQVLIRKSVFEKYGLFEGRWGSIGDFEWHMRVGLVEDCVFTPEKLATWRVHPTQATSNVHSRETRAKMIEMANCAFNAAASHKPALRTQIRIQDFIRILEIDMVELGVRSCRGRMESIKFLATEFAQRPVAVWLWTLSRLKGERWDFWNNDLRYRMLSALLKRHKIQHPEFVEAI